MLVDDGDAVHGIARRGGESAHTVVGLNRQTHPSQQVGSVDKAVAGYSKRQAADGVAAGREGDAETMKSLPEGVSAYARTATLSARSIPGQLRKSHRTRAGTWAKIVILEGRLRYRILKLDVRELELSPGCPGVVEPQLPHEVEAVGDVRFYVEFYR